MFLETNDGMFAHFPEKAGALGRRPKIWKVGCLDVQIDLPEKVSNFCTVLTTTRLSLSILSNSQQRIIRKSSELNFDSSQHRHDIADRVLI